MVILHPAWAALVDQDPVILPAIKGCALVLGICREPWSHRRHPTVLCSELLRDLLDSL